MGKIKLPRLKIVFWSETFYPTVGGTEISLYRQIKELAQLQNEIIVISPDRNKEALPINEKDIFQRIKVNIEKHILEAIETIRNLRGIDILYITRIFRNDPLTHLSAIKEVSQDVDSVLRIPTQGNIDGLSQYSLRNFLDEMAGFICLNEAIQEEIKRNLPNAKIYPHRNGVPVEEFCKSKFRKDGLYLFLGRLTNTKGLPVLLETWIKYKSSGGTKDLIVCGPSYSSRILDRLTKRISLKRYNVTYMKGTRGAWKKLENIYALIIPSLKEGHSNVMLEAMAWGIPIIASSIPGLREDISESGAGVLFKPGDPNDLLKKMQEFDRHIYSLENMSGNGKEFVRNNRTITRTVETFYDIIKDIKRTKKVFRHT